jgi:amidase
MIQRRALMSTGIAAAALSATGARADARRLTLDSATTADLSAAMAAGTLTSERLIAMSLARVARYDPVIRAIMTLNPRALETARALDAERRVTGPRSILHGIPVVLKDNIDTADLPTTGGSWVLAGSLPPRDAFIVRRLRAAGAIVLAKVNLSEFAAGDPISSMMGQTHNPYNPAYIAGGSSGGSGAAMAAAYATLALGTDTGGSVRGPSTIDGIVGLKPTTGLLSRAGIIPLGLTFDTAGPMARSVFDVAAALGVMAGADPDDPATLAAAPHALKDYTVGLDPGALRGARLGFIRNFTGNDPDYDRAILHAVEIIRGAGGTVVDITLPSWLMAVKGDFYTLVRWPEFRPQFEAYLATLKPGYPRTLDAFMARAKTLTAPSAEGYVPNPSRWALFEQEAKAAPITDPQYLNVRDRGLPLIAGALDAILRTQGLDAFVYLTTSTRFPKVGAAPPSNTSADFGSTSWGTQFASLAGFPDLVVPCGYTRDGLPIGMSLMGPAYSEARLLSLGYAFEAVAKVRHAPPGTPALKGEVV